MVTILRAFGGTAVFLGLMIIALLLFAPTEILQEAGIRSRNVDMSIIIAVIGLGFAAAGEILAELRKLNAKEST